MRKEKQKKDEKSGKKMQNELTEPEETEARSQEQKAEAEQRQEQMEKEEAEAGVESNFRRDLAGV